MKYSLEMKNTNINPLKVLVKAQSKAELYRLLTVEGNMNRPTEDQATMKFISELHSKRKEKFFGSSFLLILLI